MKRPAPDDLRLAAEWARSYEPGCDDAARLDVVADWLDAQAVEGEKAAFVAEAMRLGYTRSQSLLVWKRRYTIPSGGKA